MIAATVDLSKDLDLQFVWALGCIAVFLLLLVLVERAMAKSDARRARKADGLFKDELDAVRREQLQAAALIVPFKRRSL